MSYNRNIPQPTDLISNSQSQILGNFQAIDSGTTGTGIGFARNHVTMTDSTNGGLHNRVDFYQAVASPSISGFVSSEYPKTVTNVELFYKNTTADMQISNSLLTSSSGQGMMPGGLQIRTGTTAGPGSSFTVSYLAFPSATLTAFAISSGNSRTWQTIVLNSSSFTATPSSTLGGGDVFYWFAIGY